MPEIRPDWSRDDWLRLADRLLAAARRHASPGHARIAFPGAEGGYGHAIDGLEGFARTFLLAGFRIAGERGAGLDELAEWYARGIATGTDPNAPDHERWVRLDEHAQAKVEAASIALILDLTRPWIWDRLAPGVRERVVDYLSPAVGDDTYPPINWVWFRLVVQTFLRAVGGPWSRPEMAADLATHDTFRREGGWLSDGRRRAYDHYTGWALHTYPILWSRMSGAGDLAEARRDRDLADLDLFLHDALALVGADGSPLMQGRSLIYRFAAAAPFWAGALAGVPSHSPGRLRHAADMIVRHFADRGAPGADGLLTLGWHGPFPGLAQSYSGPGSPYWAAKGLLGLALPADHPVWAAEPEPLPIEEGDYLRVARAPGWLISGVSDDGIIRMHNHGTDHEVPGATGGDAPLYARIGYSTATMPTLERSDPLDNSVVLVDEAGRHSHRTGMRLLAIGESPRPPTSRSCGAAPHEPPPPGWVGPSKAAGSDNFPPSSTAGEPTHPGSEPPPDRAGAHPGCGLAGSTAAAHWLAPAPDRPDHGAGLPGEVTPAGQITTYSIVRGPWELRLARVDDPAPAAVSLRIGGWPVTGDLHSHLVPVLGAAKPGHTRYAAGPLGDGPVHVPWLEYPATPGIWTAALVALAREAEPPHCRARLVETGGGAEDEGHGWEVEAEWPDSVLTRTPLTKEKG